MKKKTWLSVVGYAFSGIFVAGSLAAIILIVHLFLEDKDTKEAMNDTNQTKTLAEKEAQALDAIEESKQGEGIKGYEDISEFVSDFHSFYNETTGYGAIDSLDWKLQMEKAKEAKTYLNHYGDKISNEALKRDFRDIRTMADAVINEKGNQEMIQNLHRYFHDLDMAINDYSNTTDIWGVTEFFGTGE
ncbi:hypothetical protein [Peribacillus deserti]|uniref:Uncharacterized protein n=1 Tax=Peribacillus deserti TaxID=673318 RepID=A0A2N5MBK4_9BACI|nr:hypothetical protein [Peribacillus deserti]PLT31727.1 hypothetical protein CUU66_00755 [Peribacillus deserti]